MALPVLIISSTGEKILTLLDPSNVAGTLMGVGSQSPTGLSVPAKWLGVATHVDGQAFVPADGLVLMGGYDGTGARKVLVDSTGALIIATTDPLLVTSADPVEVHAEATGAAGSPTVASLVATVGVKNCLTGFQISALGATGATSVIATVSDGVWVLSFAIEVPAGVNKQIQVIDISFDPPIAAAGVNTSIDLTVPDFGAGNTFVGASIQGVQK